MMNESQILPTSNTGRVRLDRAKAAGWPGGRHLLLRPNYGLLVFLITCLLAYAHSMDLFQVQFIETNGARLIATSNNNYAIVHPKLAERNWRAVSVNGDQVLALSLEPASRLATSRAELGAERMSFIERLRDELASGSPSGYSSQVSSVSSGGAASSFMSSTSSSGASSSSSSFQAGGGEGAELSFSAKDEANFCVSKSGLPFNWSRVFFNDDLITSVERNGTVRTLSLGLLEPAEASAVETLRAEANSLRLRQEQQLASTVQHSMDMVSGIFNNIMGRFPAPPDYRSAVGATFGDSFPFGERNSPFSSWPFGRDSAARSGAFAFAGRR